MSLHTTKGFTLIELLVVIAIIGLLSSVVLTSLNSTRIKGRDSTRVSTLKQYQVALELYRSDNGSYPVISTGACIVGASSNCTNTDLLAGAITLRTSLGTYFPGGLPTDPKPFMNGSIADGGYRYSNSTGGATYCIFSYRNPENMNNIPQIMRRLACAIPNSAGNCPNSPTDDYTTPGMGWGNRAQIGENCTP